MYLSINPKAAPHVMKLKLRKEQLDIFKNKIITGKIKIHKEVVRKEKTMVVSVKCEELVIENSQNNGHMKTIRIPISEERIEIIKHPVKLTNVSLYKRKYQTIKHIEGKLKKEKLKIETNGSVRKNNINIKGETLYYTLSIQKE